MRSVCLRCGASRARFDAICPSCGHRAEGEGLLVAWLLSSENLGDADLDAAAARIRAGESTRPSARNLDRARRALGRHFSSDPGMTRGQRLALLACSLVLTPLPGWVLAWSWWEPRPRAAIQALALSAPASVLFAIGVLWLRLR